MSSSCNLDQMLSNIYSRKCAKHLPVCAPTVSHSADWVCCTLLWQVKVFCQPESYFAQGMFSPREAQAALQAYRDATTVCTDELASMRAAALNAKNNPQAPTAEQQRQIDADISSY